jgi:hypothetical protein
MSDGFFIYMLKVNLTVSFVYLFFWLFLRNLSFYRWNRWFLISGLTLSFVLPALRIGDVSKGKLLQNISRLVPEELITGTVKVSTDPASLHLSSIIIMIWIAGCVFFLMAFVLKLRALIRLVKKSVPFTGKTRVRLINATVSPFSFLNRIYLSQAVYSQGQLDVIISHEKVHVREFHTLDILISELFSAICWFNPLAWLYKKAIKENLEFIADASVLRKGHDPMEYQLCLLDLSQRSGWEGPVVSFSMNSFKKRLYFMNRMKSSPWYQRGRYAFILPVAIILFLSFNTPLPQSGSGRKPGKSATITGQLNIYIKNDHALLTGSDGIAEIKGVNSLDIERYPNAVLLHNGKEFSIDKLRDHLPAGDPYVLNVYLGNYAQQKYGGKGKVGIVTIISP